MRLEQRFANGASAAIVLMGPQDPPLRFIFGVLVADAPHGLVSFARKPAWWQTR